MSGADDGRRIDPHALEPRDRLFRHSVRPDWGVGVWVREERTRRRLQFEDGEMRAFKRGFYDLLVPVDEDGTDIGAVFERVVGEGAEAAALDAPSEPPVMSFARQIDLFLAQFPDGFGGATYQRAWGADAPPRSSLAGAVARARALRGRKSPADAADLGIEVLGATDFVTKRKHLELAELAGEQRLELGRAILALIGGEARFGARFDDWLRALDALGIRVGWRVATTLMGLVAPNRHVVVRRRVIQLQSRSVRPSKLPQIPSIAGYRRARRILEATRDKLVAAGLSPPTLLDVHVFVWETLRPTGQQRAAAMGGTHGR
ncbi:MAG: hypothetical protein H6737_00585 [Alphaproteobacteria bacterium]|nr:hypothetical protein [Alphaproteobacteria bacterium]